MKPDSLLCTIATTSRYNGTMEVIEQRDYHRLDDNVLVEYKRVAQSDVESAGDPAAHFELPEGFDRLKLLYLLEQEARELVREIDKQQRELGKFLGNLNKRLDILSEFLGATNTDNAVETHNLSQGGVAFASQEYLETGQWLAVKVTFEPAHLAVVCHGIVRHCRLSHDGEAYLVGVGFGFLKHADEQLINRYILQRQSEARRQRLRRANYE